MSINNEEAARQIFVMTIRVAEKSTKSIMQSINKAFQKRAAKKNLIVSGKQPLKKLMKHNSSLQTVALHGKTLKLFKRVAAKYEIDFAIKKDPKNKGIYYAFFKAKDAEVLEMAFGEFSDKALNVKAPVKEQIDRSKEIANEVNQERQQQNKDIAKEKVKSNELQH